MPSALAVPIVLVDDHKMLVLGLRTLFRSRPEIDVVGIAHDAGEAIAVCRAKRPKVAVLDMTLAGAEDGLELCRWLRTELPDLEIVFYTGLDDIGLAERAAAAGAQGIVSKGDTPSDLLKAVLFASRGRSFTSPAFAAHAGPRDFEELSPKQLTALRLLAQGLERREMAEQMGIGEETVKSHLAEVRRKLGARTSAHAVAIGIVNALFDSPPPYRGADA